MAPAARLLWLDEMATPVGRLIAGVCESGVALLHFAGSERAVRHLARLSSCFDMVHDPSHPRLCQLRRDLTDWFGGHRLRLDMPCVTPAATPFQRQVWRAVARIPYGHAISYRELAARIGRPTAVRAVAAANASNPVVILIPCHRVIAADGSPGGYAGGVEAKRRLLELERRHLARRRA